MRLIYSDEVNRLSDMVDPYMDWSFPPKLKDDAPEEIKKAHEKCMKLMEQERKML